MSLSIPFTTSVVIKEEEAQLDSLLALQLYRSPSPAASTDDSDSWSNAASAHSSLTPIFEQLCDHPGEGWIPNLASCPYYHHFELPAMYGGVVAKYIKHDLTPAFPLILGTLGKGHPIHSRLLRARPVSYDSGPFTSDQRTFFDPNQPFKTWVDKALGSEDDPSLTAGVYQRWYMEEEATRLYKLISDASRRLDEVEGLSTEILNDLWKANAFERLVTQVQWQDRDDEDDIEDPVADAFHPYALLTSAAQRPPPPPPKTNKYCKVHGWSDHDSRDCKTAAACHTCRRPGHRASQCKQTICYRCNCPGHVAASCSLKRNNKAYSRKDRK
jgi:hypothetical protein